MKEPINKLWGGLLSPSLFFSPKCCFDWRIFFRFNRKNLSQQNEINYLTKRGTKGMEGGVLPPSEPRCTGRMLQSGARRGALLLPPALFSPIHCHFQDYQSAGVGAGLWLITVWQKSLIRSPGQDSKVAGTGRSRIHLEHRATQSSVSHTNLPFPGFISKSVFCSNALWIGACSSLGKSK